MNVLLLIQEINTLSFLIFTVCFIVSAVTVLLSVSGMTSKAAAISLKYFSLIWIGFSYADGGGLLAIGCSCGLISNCWEEDVFGRAGKSSAFSGGL
jgi:hypothetical protein